MKYEAAMLALGVVGGNKGSLDGFSAKWACGLGTVSVGGGC